MTLFSVVISKGSVDVLEPLSQIDEWCLFLHSRHVFQLRQSAARCLGLVQLKYNFFSLNPLSAKFIKWSNTLKQIVGKLATICLSVFDHFSGLAFKGLISTHVQFDVDLPNILYSVFYKDQFYYLQTGVYDLGV